MTTYDLFFIRWTVQYGWPRHCLQQFFQKGAPDLISGAGAEFRAISDPPDFIQSQSLLVLWKIIPLVFF